MGLSLEELKAQTEEFITAFKSFGEYVGKMLEPLNAKYLDIIRIPLRERAIHQIEQIANNVIFLCSTAPKPEYVLVVVTPNSIFPTALPPSSEDFALGYMRYLHPKEFLSIVVNVIAAMELGGLDTYLKHEPFELPNMARLLFDAIPPYGKIAAYVANPHYKTDRTIQEEDHNVMHPASVNGGTATDQNQDHDGNTGSTTENARAD